MYSKRINSKSPQSRYALFLCLFAILSSCVPEIPEERRELVIVTYCKKSKDALYSYKCKDKVFTTWGSSFTGYSLGDRFWAYLDNKNCENVEILYYMPFFYEHEQTSGINGEVVLFSKLLRGVKYKYEVNGKEYKRFQKIDFDYNEGLDKVARGRICPVEYLISNPQRSRIHLGFSPIVSSND